MWSSNAITAGGILSLTKGWAPDRSPAAVLNAGKSGRSRHRGSGAIRTLSISEAITGGLSSGGSKSNRRGIPPPSKKTRHPG